MAKVYQRKDSPYLWIDFSYNKKRYRKKTKYEATKDNIKLVENEILPLMLQKIRKGQILLDQPKTNNTFEHYSNLYLKSKIHLKTNSYNKYKKELLFWNNHFKNREIKSIKASEIKECIFSLNIELQTIKSYLVPLNGVFNEALIDDEIESNVISKIKLPRAIQKEIIPFSKDEVNKILDCATGFFRNYLAVAFYTGCRTGELLSMKWQNIDFENKRIYINSTVGSYKETTTKTGKSRYVPIFDILYPFLENQKKTTGLKTYVFCTRTGKPYASTNLYRYYWKPLLKQINVPLKRMYETRHTFATNMLESQNFNLNQIASWLGHSNIQTLIRSYNKFIPSENMKFDSSFNVFDTNLCHVENEYISKAM